MGGDERLSDKERHAYLAMAERRARPGSGSGENTLCERSARYGTPQLNRHLAGVRLRLPGSPGRRWKHVAASRRDPHGPAGP